MELNANIIIKFMDDNVNDDKKTVKRLYKSLCTINDIGFKIDDFDRITEHYEMLF